MPPRRPLPTFFFLQSSYHDFIGLRGAEEGDGTGGRGAGPFLAALTSRWFQLEFFKKSALWVRGFYIPPPPFKSSAGTRVGLSLRPPSPTPRDLAPAGLDGSAGRRGHLLQESSPIPTPDLAAALARPAMGPGPLGPYYSLWARPAGVGGSQAMLWDRRLAGWMPVSHARRGGRR